jgi:hypothetical protein
MFCSATDLPRLPCRSACDKLYSDVCVSAFALADSVGVANQVLTCSRTIGDPAMLTDYTAPNFFASWKGTPFLRPDSYTESINGVSATVQCVKLVKEGGLGEAGSDSGAPKAPPKCPRKVCKEPMIMRRLPNGNSLESRFIDESEEAWQYCNTTDDCNLCSPSCYMPCPVRCESACRPNGPKVA